MVQIWSRYVQKIEPTKPSKTTKWCASLASRVLMRCFFGLWKRVKYFVTTNWPGSASSLLILTYSSKVSVLYVVLNVAYVTRLP